MDTSKIKYPLGLALSGGSIKGFAHIGVLKYMDEIGLRPDIIAGTSSGSIVGAFYSDGYTPDEIFERLSSIGFKGMTSLYPNKGGMFSTRNFTKFLKDNLRHRRLEDLPIPVRIVATDLDNGCEHVFTSGPLSQIITASCSIPVLFQPKVIKGISYVDGGLFRNYPVTVIRQECAKVLGVNLGPEQTKECKKTLRGVAERSWSLVFRQNTRADKAVCDLTLETHAIMQYKMFDVSSAKDIMELGYELARHNHIESLLPIKSLPE